jgi:hypothetical protein
MVGNQKLYHETSVNFLEKMGWLMYKHLATIPFSLKNQSVNTLGATKQTVRQHGPIRSLCLHEQQEFG